MATIVINEDGFPLGTYEVRRNQRERPYFDVIPIQPIGELPALKEISVCATVETVRFVWEKVQMPGVTRDGEDVVRFGRVLKCVAGEKHLERIEGFSSIWRRGLVDHYRTYYTKTKETVDI